MRKGEWNSQGENLISRSSFAVGKHAADPVDGSSKSQLRRSAWRSLLLGPMLFIATVIAFLPAQIQANTIAISYRGGEALFNPHPYDATAGWEFSLSAPVLLTDLGVWADFDVLRNSHQVTVWTEAGVQVAQATVDNSGTLTLGFVYVPLSTPVLLPVGDYVIGAFYASQFSQDDADAFFAKATSITTAPGVTYNESRSVLGNAFPSGDFSDNPFGYFGPNFQFTGVAVPESSSTWMLLAISLATMYGLSWCWGWGRSGPEQRVRVQ